MLQERRNESFWLHPKQLWKPVAYSLALPLTYLSPPHRMAFAWPYLFHLREGQQSQTVPLIHSNVSKLIFCSNGVLELLLEKSRLPLRLSCWWWLPQSGLSWTMVQILLDHGQEELESVYKLLKVHNQDGGLSSYYLRHRHMELLQVPWWMMMDPRLPQYHSCSWIHDKFLLLIRGRLGAVSCSIMMQMSPVIHLQYSQFCIPSWVYLLYYFWPCKLAGRILVSDHGLNWHPLSGSMES